jgi:hypothetical protein
MKSKALIIIVFAILLSGIAFSQNKETAPPHTFPKEKIEKYKNSNDFKYGENAPIQSTFWNKLKYKLAEFIKYFFSNKGAMPIVRYITLGLAIIFILYKIFELNSQLFFGKKQTKINRENLLGEVTNITTINFEDQAKRASINNDLRLATRFLFLHTLQTLEINSLIKWEIEKTNTQYISELKIPNMAALFREIVIKYNFTWYGHFDINQQQFNKLNEKVNELKQIAENSN